MNKKIVAVILGLALVLPMVASAQTVDNTQTILTGLLQQLIVLYTQELQQLEQQLATMQANQIAMQNQINNETTTPPIVQATSTETSTYTQSPTLNQIQQVAPTVVQPAPVTEQVQQTVAAAEEPVLPTSTTLTVMVSQNPAFTSSTYTQNSVQNELASFILTNQQAVQMGANGFVVRMNSNYLENVYLSSPDNNVKTVVQYNATKAGTWLTFFSNNNAVSISPNGSTKLDIYGDIMWQMPTGTYQSLVDLCGFSTGDGISPDDGQAVDSSGSLLISSSCMNDIQGQPVTITQAQIWNSTTGEYKQQTSTQ